MCNFKSAIILKDRVYISDITDSHTELLEELGIEDTEKNANNLFVRAELIPIYRGVFSDINTWKFVVDQDILPKWYVHDFDKERMINAVKEWANSHIYIGLENQTIINKQNIYLKDCKNIRLENTNVRSMYGTSRISVMDDTSSIKEMYDTSSIVEMYGTSSVGKMYDKSSIWEMYDTSSVIEMYDTSNVGRMNDSSRIIEMYDTSSVGRMHNSSSVGKMYDTSSVIEMYDTSIISAMYGSSSIREMYGTSIISAMYDSSSIEIMYDSSSITLSPLYIKNIENIILMDDSTIKDRRTKTIHQSGDWELVLVNNEQK